MKVERECRQDPLPYSPLSTAPGSLYEMPISLCQPRYKTDNLLKETSVLHSRLYTILASGTARLEHSVNLERIRRRILHASLDLLVHNGEWEREYEHLRKVQLWAIIQNDYRYPLSLTHQ